MLSGTNVAAGQQLVERGGVHPPGLDHLAVVEVERPVVDDDEAAHERGHVVVHVVTTAELAQLHTGARPGVDAHLLAQFADRGERRSPHRRRRPRRPRGPSDRATRPCRRPGGAPAADRRCRARRCPRRGAGGSRRASAARRRWRPPGRRRRPRPPARRRRRVTATVPSIGAMADTDTLLDDRARRGPRPAPRRWSSCAGSCTPGRRSATTCPVTRETVLAALEGLPLDITLHETTSGIAAVLDGGQPGPDGAAARRHGRAADARGHRPRLRARRSTGRCTPAATTRTRDARRRGTAARARQARPRRVGCCSCSSPARRASRRREVHARGGPARHRPTQPTARESPRHRRVRHAHHLVDAHAASSAPARGRSWPRPTGC